MNLLEKINKIAPKTYDEISLFLNVHHIDLLKQINKSDFEIKDEMLLGLIFDFFDKNGVDFSISTTNIEIVCSEIMAEISNFENTISHFS